MQRADEILSTKRVSPAGPIHSSKPHVKALDGLRGVAVLAVLLVHTGAPFTRMGWLGVDLFFVLSGFLITTLLAREFDRTGRVSLPKFWGRRILRLMPAYWLYVGSVTILMLTSSEPMTPHMGWQPGTFIVSMWCYFANCLPLGGFHKYNHLTYHLWSLCVEEQFYFLWPVLCVLALRLRRPYLVGWVILAAISMWRLFPHTKGYLLFRLDTRGLAIVMGCTAALMTWRLDSPSMRAMMSAPKLRWGVIATAILLIGWAAIIYERNKVDETWIVKWLTPIFAVQFTLMVCMLWYGREDGFTRVMSWRWLAYIGTISYGLYLYHMVAHYVTWQVLLKDIEHWWKYGKFALRVFVYIGLSFGIAVASYHLYEERFLSLKDRLR